MSQLSTTHYEVDSLEQLSGDYVNGDTAVVKTKIGVDALSNDILSYTAYIYDSKVSNWKAMDGNYNANNVYFKDDIVTAGSWEKVGNLSHTKNTVGSLDVSSKSLTEVMDMIFKGEEGYPTKPTPSCGISQTAQSVEVGTTVTPKFTVSFDEKTYAYGTNTNTGLNTTTGVTAATYTLTYKDKDNTVKTLSGTCTAKKYPSQSNQTITASESFQAKAGTNSSGGNLSVSYNAATDGTYIPRSNLERVLSSASELSTYRVTNGTATSGSTTNSIIGYYPNFNGFRTAENSFDPENITSENIASLTKYTTSPNASTGLINPQTSLTTSGKWRQWFYLMPSAINKSSAEALNSNKLPVTIKKAKNTVTVNHPNGLTSTYDVFYSQQEADASATTLTITWK